MAERLQSLTFTNQSDGEKAKMTKGTCEDFLKFTIPHKTRPKRKTNRNFPNLAKKFPLHIIGYTDLDAGLDPNCFEELWPFQWIKSDIACLACLDPSKLGAVDISISVSNYISAGMMGVSAA